MSENQDDKNHLHWLWTGAMSIEMEPPGKLAGLLGEVTPLSEQGVVKLSFFHKTCPSENDESSVSFYLTENTARNLVEQLSKVIHRAETLRVFHRQGRLPSEFLCTEEELSEGFKRVLQIQAQKGAEGTKERDN